MESCECTPMASGVAGESEVRRMEGVCPTNGKPGRHVDSLTLKAMLARPLTELRPVEYRFCTDAKCPTVYYSMDGAQIFTEADLRERVYQKHPDEQDVFVCYCFRNTVKEVRLDAAATGGATVTTLIHQGIQNGQCACDIRNPQGSCCLGNVNHVIKQAKYRLA